jgi:L-ascorbate metabolism protein UlaG (beta-lactamase superfamily)
MRTWTRRSLISAAGAGGLSAGLYSLQPEFWQRFFAETERPVAPPPSVPQPARWPDRGLHAAWIGHTTVLLKIDGFTILTDPAFSERVGIELGFVTLGPKRLVAPALPLSDVPAPDLILLSHAHMDHFDLPSLRALGGKRTAVVTAAETSDLIRPGRYASVREMRWGEQARVGPVRLRAFEVKHWGARTRADYYRGYNGYEIQAGRYRVLFAGDTGLTDAFLHLRNSKPFDLAIIPIGCYNPYISNHCNPEQAVRMANEARAERVLAVHHSTFQLSREPAAEPMERLLTAVSRSPERLALRHIGEEFHCV